MSQYLPYHEESIACAKELVRGVTDAYKKYKIITNYVSKNFMYDHIRAIEIPKKNAFPDVARCWEKRMGICMDIAAMTTKMLQAVGLKAVMCYGHTERTYHAWVEVTIGKKTYRYDHNGKAKVYKRERVFRS